jgi:O-acetyl-ADP-ribose deacetylase (regulator of RNase III)
MPRGRVEGLYYITHIDNVPSILEHGILCHSRIEDEEIPYTPVYDKGIVANRRAIATPDGRNLWSFANLYFQPRNPMLYRVLHEKPANDIAVLAVQPSILGQPDIFISTGNAAHSLSEILPASKGVKVVPQIRRETDKDWWTEADGSKRKIMAECLVPGSVPPDLIQTIYVASHEAAARVKATPQALGRAVIPEPRMFFQPFRRTDLTPLLSIVEGDMFFSRMQTLTVSVNTVGVMGKGVASRAKYQFPDVYVVYQDVCRSPKLRMGRPYLYKREISFENDLADEPFTLANANSETWFLLFATKRHWRQPADIHGIEEGVRWLADNYKSEGIKSLALPALGCGLGWLEWRDVGPVICRPLSALDIQVQIYLPVEKKIPDELLTRAFLLGQGA